MCGHKAAVSWEADVCLQEPVGDREGVRTEADAGREADRGRVPVCVRRQSRAGEDLGETGMGGRFFWYNIYMKKKVEYYPALL